MHPLRTASIALAAWSCAALALRAQDQDQGPPPLSIEEIDALVAPIALYPDALLAQVLMAATYPLEIVEADRWMRSNGGLAGDDLARALEQEGWDASVKSLANFPRVLETMSDKLDWTTRLGNAFLAQEDDVMGSVQRLRAQAYDAGNLRSMDQVDVDVLDEGPGRVFVIRTPPDVIYCPTYDPFTVYGAWRYDAFPPFPFFPFGFFPHASLSFGFGVPCGVPWGYAWGHFSWGHGPHFGGHHGHWGGIDIDIDQNIHFNPHIDKTVVKQKFAQANPGAKDGKGAWQHDASHRRGIAYRDGASAQKYGGRTRTGAARSRESYRGRGSAGRGGSAGAAPALGGHDRTSTRSGSSRSGATRPGTTTPKSNASPPRSGSAPQPGRSGIDRGRSTAPRGGASSSGSRGSSRSTGRQGGAFRGFDRGSSAWQDGARGRSDRGAGSRGSGSRESGSRGSGSRDSGNHGRDGRDGTDRRKP